MPFFEWLLGHPPDVRSGAISAWYGQVPALTGRNGLSPHHRPACGVVQDALQAVRRDRLAGEPAHHVPAVYDLGELHGAAPAISGASVDGAGGPGTSQAAQDAGAPPAAASETAVPVSSTTAPPPEESLNLVRLVGPAMAKRAVPVIIAVLILLLSLRAMRRRQRPDGEA